jgi:hypothetical protein
MMAAGIAWLDNLRRIGTALCAVLVLAAVASPARNSEASDLPNWTLDQGIAISAEMNRAPADVVALRFPPEWQLTAAGEPSANNSDHQPVGGVLAFAAQPPPAETGVAAMISPWTLGRPWWLSGAVSALQTLAAEAEVSHLPPRSAVFNDAQIAAMKRRLSLTRRQQRYWPPVAAALRSITWQRAGRAPHNGVIQAGNRAIDPNGAAVQRLNRAIAPLIKSLDNQQKGEVRMLLNLAGLGRLARSF